MVWSCVSTGGRMMTMMNEGNGRRNDDASFAVQLSLREIYKTSRAKTDMLTVISFNLHSDKPYADLHVDLVRFNSEGKIAQLREFFDTRHVHDHVEEHHSKTDEKK